MKNYGKKSVQRLLLVLILILSYNCKPKMEAEEANETPVKAPEQIIEISEAKDMYERYAERRVPLIQRYEDSINRGMAGDKMQQRPQGDKNQAQMEAAPEKFDVARYVYYDYATIKNYIAYIEQEAKAANVDISTLRFYFSNYSEDPKNVHPRQNSIMLSPTIKKGDRDYLFYIGDLEGKAEAVLLNDAFGPVDASGMGNAPKNDGKSYASFIPNLIMKSNASLPYYQSGKSVTMNEGNGAPPPYQ
ncbi:MAG: hypothetical protein MUO53_14260 [Maribacter sp.]|nr:hypothetical protein [Maribacter sp.]